MLFRICYPQNLVTVYHPHAVVKYFNGYSQRISSAPGLPGHVEQGHAVFSASALFPPLLKGGKSEDCAALHLKAHVLTSVSNASKLVPLRGVAVPLPMEKHCGVTGG